MKCSPLLAVYHKSKLPKCNIPKINCHILVILVITACCCQINWVNPPMDVIWMWNSRSVTKLCDLLSFCNSLPCRILW